jgi:hypothetical protein
MLSSANVTSSAVPNVEIVLNSDSTEPSACSSSMGRNSSDAASVSSAGPSTTPG